MTIAPCECAERVHDIAGLRARLRAAPRASRRTTPSVDPMYELRVARPCRTARRRWRRELRAGDVDGELPRAVGHRVPLDPDAGRISARDPRRRPRRASAAPTARGARPQRPRRRPPTACTLEALDRAGIVPGTGRSGRVCSAPRLVRERAERPQPGDAHHHAPRLPGLPARAATSVRHAVASVFAALRRRGTRPTSAAIRRVDELRPRRRPPRPPRPRAAAFSSAIS